MIAAGPAFVVLAVLAAACVGTDNTTVTRSRDSATSTTTAPPSTERGTIAPPTVSTTVPPALRQTHDLPSVDAAFRHRMDALWRAIVDDRPDEATESFFPLSAYLRVKAVRDPAADWQSRLVAAYAADIHQLHDELHPSASAGAIEPEAAVPEHAAIWVVPGRESNKLGYWRVYGTHLRVGTSTVEIRSMISWRGEWYVVHLRPIS